MGRTQLDMRVDHVGIAVESIADAEPFLMTFGCEKMGGDTIESEGFTWNYYRLGEASRLELIEPLAGTESFLTDYLEQNGPGLHHVTLEVGNLKAAVERIEAAGVRVVDKAEMEGYSEAFVSPRNPTGATFQLMEYHDSYVEEFGDEMLIGGRQLSASGE